MDEILTHSETNAAKSRAAMSRSTASTPSGTTVPVDQLQELIGQKLEKTERLLTEARWEADGEVKAKESAEAMRAEAERLLKEAAAAWGQAREVLEEVKELRALYQQLDSSSSNSTKQNPARAWCEPQVPTPTVRSQQEAVSVRWTSDEAAANFF